jgi:uncharacterized membrane protein
MSTAFPPSDPAQSSARLQHLAHLARRATLIAYGLLLAAIAVNRLTIALGGWRNDAIIWLVQSLPLLIFLPGLWRGTLTSYVWLCFVLLIYFAAAVTQLFLPHWRLLDTIHLALVVALFSFSLLFIRWRGRANRMPAHA